MEQPMHNLANALLFWWTIYLFLIVPLGAALGSLGASMATALMWFGIVAIIIIAILLLAGFFLAMDREERF